MDIRALQNVHAIAAAVFVAAVLVLAVQLITPSPIVVSVGGDGTQATPVGHYFTYRDVAVAVVAAGACGVSGTYLLVHDRAHRTTRPVTGGSPGRTNGGAVGVNGGGTSHQEPREDRHEQWEETVARLRNNEETIYATLVDADGELAQRELVERTDLSKATVSRTLDKLENRDLLERRRTGLGNTIYLL
ncbi:helix-turn-helix transcriptional regulator [Halorarius halobius]|uniref:helix-turn-helix transcriptional regulator n=1 Tax=Halorarius halobius TaxID=2962671 RepID=UPI0020CF26DC|nr:MarR family transcriptional regulator [Halorarius halobius]